MLPSPGVVDHLGFEPGGDFAPPPFTVVIHITGVIPHPGSVFPDCHEERGWSNAPFRGWWWEADSNRRLRIVAHGPAVFPAPPIPFRPERPRLPVVLPLHHPTV